LGLYDADIDHHKEKRDISTHETSNSSLEEVIDIVAIAKKQFLSGEMHCYEIAEYFMDGLLETANSNQII
jgi:ubiquitin C-terminal hydrolase